MVLYLGGFICGASPHTQLTLAKTPTAVRNPHCLFVVKSPSVSQNRGLVCCGCGDEERGGFVEHFRELVMGFGKVHFEHFNTSILGCVCVGKENKDDRWAGPTGDSRIFFLILTYLFEARVGNGNYLR